MKFRRPSDDRLSADVQRHITVLAAQSVTPGLETLARAAGVIAPTRPVRPAPPAGHKRGRRT